MDKGGTSRNFIMDWLRGLAAVWVVLFHLNETIVYRDEIWQIICKPGWLGVPAFFAISGWCMSMVSERRQPWNRFAIARLARIFIPYWVSLGVVVLVVVFRIIVAGQNDVTTLPRSIGSIFAAAGLATSPVTDLPTINWVYWSLSYEVLFYCLVAISLVSKRGGVIMFILLLFALMPSVVSWQAPFAKFRPFFWADQYPLFCIGYFGSRSDRTGLSFIFLSFLVAALISFYTLPAAVVVVALGATFLLKLERHLPSPQGVIRRTMDSLGRWSYSLYLLHVPIGVYLIGHLRNDWILANPLRHVAFDLANLAVCVALSALFYRWVESPSHALARKLGAGGRTTASVRNSVMQQG